MHLKQAFFLTAGRTVMEQTMLAAADPNIHIFRSFFRNREEFAHIERRTGVDHLQRARNS